MSQHPLPSLEELEKLAQQELARIEKLKQEAPLRTKQRLQIPQQQMANQDPQKRRHTVSEVALGYSEAQALVEAERCLQCKNAPCVANCPVGIDIPGFIRKITERDFEGAYSIITQSSLLPAVCGRVCPQESQCQAPCTVGKSLKDTFKSVSIGRLERFVADWVKARVDAAAGEAGGSAAAGGSVAAGEAGGAHSDGAATSAASAHEPCPAHAPAPASAPALAPAKIARPTGKKIGIIGTGPASITAATDLRRYGHSVTMFEALHKAGGVLMYGIPEFRLPKKIVEAEIQNLRDLGVEIQTNFLAGSTRKIHDMLNEDGYDALFIGSGAGLPRFMNIEGENLIGVFAANEYLTRANLMRAYEKGKAATPMMNSKNVAVLGGGNVAMDAARTAVRLGAENVYVIYRRTRAEMPARAEEVDHAEEEGIIFHFLNNPTRILGDDQQRVNKIELLKHELGEPDDSGRRRPIPIPGSEHSLPVDTVIVSIGNNSNPLLIQNTPGLNTNAKGNIKVDDAGRTSLPGVYAGGDIVLGAATVILAMGQGRVAAKTINQDVLQDT